METNFSDQTRLLSIVGLTATGKTALAFALAEQLLATKTVSGVDIISADSKQVYQGLNILTGADIPKDFKKQSASNGPYIFFEKNHIRLYGVDCILPNEQWSVADFQQMARLIIQESWSSSRLPIVVGGTGLYHEHLFNDQLADYPGPQLDIRQSLEQTSVAELQEKLAHLWPEKLSTMNESDRQNPRRLIRAIEVGTVMTKKNRAISASTQVTTQKLNKPTLQLTFGLTAPMTLISQNITQRVAARFHGGSQAEITRLMQLDPRRLFPIWSILGASEIAQYCDSKIDQDTCLAVWTQKEIQYAKRQQTWWKKRTGITWLSSNNPVLEATKIFSSCFE